MDKPAEIRIINSEHLEPAALPKCGCGGDPKIGHYNIHVSEFYHVYCDKCGRETKTHSSESEAIKDWCKWPDLPFGKRKAEGIINA